MLEKIHPYEIIFFEIDDSCIVLLYCMIFVDGAFDMTQPKKKY